MRGARTLALTVVAVATLVAPLGGIAAAGQGNGGSGGGSGGGKPEVLATLKIDNPNVEVKKKGENDFKPATEGQKLREGDTVRTDGTGKAEVDYSDDAYTRLDVNTTFKIVKLTEEQGERQIEGGLESGRTWNRTEAVTESGSFEQSGGGATAAVTGTAFAVECTSLTECTYQAIVDTTDLTGKDGEKRTLTPLTECDSDDGALCDEISRLTPEEIAANAWIQENLLRDLLERGYGPGPFVVGGVLRIVDGVITFEETTPVSTPTTTPTTTAPAPQLGEPPLLCELYYPTPTYASDNCTYALEVGDLDLQPTSEIVVYGDDEVIFKANVVANGASKPVYIVFDEIPNQGDDEEQTSSTGQYCLNSDVVGGEGNDCAEGKELITGKKYPADSLFRFIADYVGDCECVAAFGTLRFHLESADGQVSGQAVVNVSVCGWYGCGEQPDVDGVAAATSAPSSSQGSQGGGSQSQGQSTSSTTTTAPSTTTTAPEPVTTSTTSGPQGDATG